MGSIIVKILGFFTTLFSFISGKELEKNSIINKQQEEELKQDDQKKRIDNYVDNLDRADVINILQKLERDD